MICGQYNFANSLLKYVLLLGVIFSLSSVLILKNNFLLVYVYGSFLGSNL